MRRAPVRLSLGLAAVLPLLLSCGDQPMPAAPEPPGEPPPTASTPAPTPPSLGIFDAGSPGGNPFFHWLPPIREDRTFTGTFDATLLPTLTVEVCALAPAGDRCAGPPLRTFTSAGVDHYEAIQLSSRREYYQVYLDTRGADVDPATHYRVRVLGGDEHLLGHADVDVAATPGELAGVDPGEHVGVLKGQWLALRWRAEQGVLTFNTPPTLAITAPADGATFAAGATASLEGTASDAQDGELSAQIAWSSDVDGALGTGADVDVVLTAGEHTITASVTDGHGATTSATVDVSVAGEQAAPEVEITAPADDASFAEATAITFTGTATDAEDGDLAARIAWSSSMDGALGTGASVTATLSVGRHTITASVTDDDGATGTDAIEVTVTSVEPPPAGLCSGALVNGENHLCAISVPGELDEFTFTGADGDYVELSAAEVGPDEPVFSPYVRLVSPTGRLIEGRRGTVAQISQRLTETGTYRVIVSSWNGVAITGVGEYRLTLAQVPGTFVVPAGDEGGPLTNGENHAGTIALGDLDQWTFTAADGDYVELSAAEVGADEPDFSPYVRLVSPTGRLIEGRRGTVAQISQRLTEDGTYRVIVSSWNGVSLTGVGDYRLTLAHVPGAFVVPADDDGGSLTNGENHMATIALGDLDQWTFTAAAGDYVELSAGAEGAGGPGFSPYIRLVSPTGRLIEGRRGAVAQISQRLTETGAYRVIVSSWNGVAITGTGEYRLTLAHVPGDFVVPAGDEGGPLSNGENHTGAIVPGDLDQWSFAAADGDYVELSVAEMGPDAAEFSPYVRLVSPSGRLIEGRRGTVAQISQRLTETGTYRVIVSSWNGVAITGAGDYRLTLAQVPGTFVVPAGDEGGPLSSGVSHAGTIALGDLDQWTFTAAAGDYVELSAAEVGPDEPVFSPYIRLVSPSGRLIEARRGTVAQIARNLTESGTYRVIVSSWNGVAITGVGNYRLVLLR